MIVEYILSALILAALFLIARNLDRGITAKERLGLRAAPGQDAVYVIAGVSYVLIASALISLVMHAHPFFGTVLGTYAIIFVSFVVSGLRMLWGDIKRDRKKGAK